MKKIVVVFLTIFPLLISTKLLSFNSIEDLQREIDKHHLKWKAKSSPIWNLSWEDKKKLLGWDPSFIDSEFVEEHTIEVKGEIEGLPDSFDWRNVNGYNWMTPVKDQAQCGSCWAFAIAGAFEANLKIKYYAPEEDVDLSEQDLTSCSCSGCDGGDISCAFYHLNMDGIPDEECDPYRASDPPCGTGLCEDNEMRSRKLEDAYRIPSNIDVIKQYIMQGPLYVTFVVYESFFGYGGGVYEPIPGEPVAGGHAVVMLGWNDADSSWLCKNSWGNGWGMEGYFKIKWGTCGIDDYPWQLIPKDPEYPYITIDSIKVFDENGDGDGVLNPGERANLTFYLKNHGTWAYASNVHLTVYSDSPYLTLLDSESDFPGIPPGSVVGNTTSPIQVIIDPTAPPEPIMLHLTITANGDGDLPLYQREYEYPLEVSYFQYGWPVHTEGFVYSSPIFLKDGEQNYIVTGGGGQLYCLRPDGSLKDGFPINIGEDLKTSQAVGDLDADGQLEIVAVPQMSPLYIVNLEGEVEKELSFEGNSMCTPVLVNLDDDPKLEITFGTLNGSLYALNYDGTPVDQFPISIGEPIIGVSTCDINGDHSKELLVATLSGKVFAFKKNGESIEGWPFTSDGSLLQPVSIAKLSGEDNEILFGTMNGTFYCLDQNGNVLWTYTVDHPIRTSPSFVDIDLDGKLEIFFGTDDGYLYGLKSNGSPINPNWPKSLGQGIRAEITFSDLDNDGTPEVIAVTKDGIVHALNQDAEEITGFPVNTWEASECTPTISDIDEDGDLEIIGGNRDGIFAIDVKTQGNSSVYWHTYGAAYQRTHDYDDLSLIVRENNPKRNERPWRASIIGPTPSMEKVFIEYTIPKGALVTISVFDSQGRIVRNLLNEVQKAGNYKTLWDLRDNRGKSVSNGVYFFKFQAKNYIQTGKILILR